MGILEGLLFFGGSFGVIPHTCSLQDGGVQYMYKQRQSSITNAILFFQVGWIASFSIVVQQTKLSKTKKFQMHYIGASPNHHLALAATFLGPY